MTAPDLLTRFPALEGLPVAQAHVDQCAQFGHAREHDSNLCPRCGALTCRGTRVLPIPTGRVLALIDETAGYEYVACPGCADCDRVLVDARIATKYAVRDPFKGLPCGDDEDF